VRKVHATGDGSPKGLLATLGWDRIVGKTPNDVLIKVLDAIAEKAKLVEKPAQAQGNKTEKPGPVNDDDIPVADERPSTRMTPVPAAPGDLAEAQLMNATVGGNKSTTRTSAPPNSNDLIDNLFSESKLPPPEEQDQIVVVEEDIDMQGAANESPTSRPPPPDEQPMMLNKARNNPPSGNTPAARRR
jgi:hypothetical protein